MKETEEQGRAAFARTRPPAGSAPCRTRPGGPLGERRGAPPSGGAGTPAWHGRVEPCRGEREPGGTEDSRWCTTRREAHHQVSSLLWHVLSGLHRVKMSTHFCCLEWNSALPFDSPDTSARVLGQRVAPFIPSGKKTGITDTLSTRVRHAAVH